MAVVRDRRAGTLTAVVRVTGRGFPLATPAEQDRSLAGWGAALSPLGRERSPVSRVVWQESALMAGGSEGHHMFLEQAGTRRRESDPAVADYLALVDQQQPAGHQVHVTLTVEQRRIRSRGSARSRLDTALDVLAEEMRLFIGRLEIAGLTSTAPMDAGELAMVVRERSDPTGSAQLAGPRRSLASAAGRVPVEWGPMTVEPGWGHVRVDGSWHRTYRVGTWPGLPVPADWLAPLLTGADATRTVCVVMEPVPMSQSTRAADREAMAREAEADSKGRRGFRLNAAERKRMAEVEARERELAQGHAEFRFAAIVDVCAAGEDQLHDAAAAVEQAAAQSLVDLRPLQARHDAGWVACLPLGRNVTTRGGHGL